MRNGNWRGFCAGSHVFLQVNTRETCLWLLLSVCPGRLVLFSASGTHKWLSRELQSTSRIELGAIKQHDPVTLAKALDHFRHSQRDSTGAAPHWKATSRIDSRHGHRGPHTRRVVGRGSSPTETAAHHVFFKTGCAVSLPACNIPDRSTRKHTDYLSCKVALSPLVEARPRLVGASQPLAWPGRLHPLAL